MKTKIKDSIISKLAIALLMLVLIVSPVLIKTTVCSFETNIGAKAYILMDKNSQRVLVDSNSHEHLPIASVTKLMTILLTLENIDNGNVSLDDDVFISENASGMGGSQVFIDGNQNYKLGELLKSVIVASANDSSVALAEHIAGSENNFVRLMNERANELNMFNTNYANCTGLPTPSAYSCAYDQAILLSKILDYDTYQEYSHIWMEDFTHPSGRTTQMTNTNKLSRFYSGCLGGKTGSTNEAKYCLAVGAKRDNMSLISVVLGAPSTKERFGLASSLLDYGFSNFMNITIFSPADLVDKAVSIKGSNEIIGLYADHDYSIICSKDEKPIYSLSFNLPTTLKNVTEGEKVGSVEVIVDGVVVDTIDLFSNKTIQEKGIWDYFRDIVKA